SLHVKKDSMYNTPPVFPIYAALQTLKYYKELGGLDYLEKESERKALLLYNEIDRNKMFVGTAVKEDRSYMNICFVMADEYQDKEDAFVEFVGKYGIVGIKGHRSVGGFRASNYNALPMESMKVLVQAMQDFEKLY
ncbi:MAG: aminotransferase class V-fold PLP-dependent enzyme, partial [Tannerellaceae bacterium]